MAGYPVGHMTRSCHSFPAAAPGGSAGGAAGRLRSDMLYRPGFAPNPLRGRDGELALLHEHLTRLRSGTGTIWLIEGGPGLGKSRLVEQAVSAAQAAGFAVGRGVAEPGDAAVELAVLMDALAGGPEPVIDRSALGDSRASREQRYW